MRLDFRFIASLSVMLLLFVTARPAEAVLADFEQFSDLESVTNQIGGVTFSNAIALQAGLSLNEFEFPPRSGSTVLSDDFGAMSILFSTKITSFSAYFTYLTQLTITAFDYADVMVASATSAFDANMVFSGDLGSSANELLTLMHGSGIRRVSITGFPDGGSFVMDDMSFDTAVSTVPTPSSPALFALALALLAAHRGVRRRS